MRQYAGRKCLKKAEALKFAQAPLLTTGIPRIVPPTAVQESSKFLKVTVFTVLQRTCICMLAGTSRLGGPTSAPDGQCRQYPDWILHLWQR
jgi:hypothetical protein